jgi:hypothetical protein
MVGRRVRMTEGIRFDVAWEKPATVRMSAVGTLRSWEQGEELVRQVLNVRDRSGVALIVVDISEIDEFASLPRSMLEVLIDNPPIGTPRIVVEGPAGQTDM